MKRFLSLSLIAILFACSHMHTYATEFEVVPGSTKDSKELGNTVDCVAGTETSTGACVNIKGKTVRDRYNNVSKTATLGDQFATGIFSRDGILQYLVYIVKFISQAGILVGAIMIIVAGYKYASAVFTGATPSMKDVKNAIIGVLVIIFAYAIIRALTAAFL